MKRLCLAVLLFAAAGCTSSNTPVDDEPHRPHMDPNGPEVPFTLDVESLPESPDFPFTVTAGDASTDSFVAWTRYVGAMNVELVVWSKDPTELVDLHQDVTVLEGEGIVNERVGPVAAGTDYHFAFVTLDDHHRAVARSAIGRVQTAWEPGTLAPLRFIATGDSKGTLRPFTLFDPMASEEASFLIYNGDTVYADGSFTVDEYRSVYRHNWEDEYFQKVLPRFGFYSIWDDHEVANDWNPEETDPVQLANATQVFLEYTPLSMQTDGRLWRKYRWGDTAEVFILDCRSERLPSQDQYISAEQMEWLKTSLQESTAVFKFIVNSVPISTYLVGADDRWEGYPAQRTEILDFLATEQISNTYWLSADFHAAIVAKLPSVPGSRDFVMGPVAQTLVPVWGLMEVFDHVEYANGLHYNYFVFEADPETETLTVQIKDEQGAVFFEGTYDGVN